MVVGSVELVPLVDAIGVLGALAELYPETPLPDWERYRVLYPELFAGDSWRVFCTCYLILSRGESVLVDTGVGPPGLWDWDPEWGGGLLPALPQQGVAPADVDVVLLAELVDRPLLAVCGHYPGGGIGRVVTRDEAVVWKAA